MFFALIGLFAGLFFGTVLGFNIASMDHNRKVMDLRDDLTALKNDYERELSYTRDDTGRRLFEAEKALDEIRSRAGWKRVEG